MLFVRLHLDDCDATNGAMEIALESHRRGVVRATEAASVAGEHACEITTARHGDILVLKMLTLHRSGRSDGAAPRRALRLDYAAAPLPPPLDWAG